MDLLIDVNIAVDVCAERQPHAEASAAALDACQQSGGRLWVYTGSLQTLQFNLAKELTTNEADSRPPPSFSKRLKAAAAALADFTADKHWLAALATEGPVWHDPDPEDAQLIRALDRFPKGQIKLLTRDDQLRQRHPDHTITPIEYLGLPAPGQNIPFIDLAAQQNAIRPQLEHNIHRVLHHGQYIMGPEVRELEQRLQHYTGAKHCITVASGTEALLISLMALGIGPGDEVITTPFTFIATAEVIVLLGARPVFVDIAPDTCNINAALIEEKITERTKAIMPVSLYGQPADMDEINAIAARHGNIPVIEDAAQSFGAEYKGRKSCNLSTIGCTSFFPSKPLGCYGDGGAIFTSDDAIAQACREIRVHGQSQRYVHTRIGVGGRMDTLQCAVVLAKLDGFDREVQQRITLGQRYNQLIDNAGIQRVQQRNDRTSVFAQYTVMPENREAAQARLKQADIPTAVHYPVPLNRQPAYQHLCCPECTPLAAQAANAVISLPMHPNMRETDLKSVASALAVAAVR